MMLEAAARSGGLKAVVSEGAGIRSAREAGERSDAGPLQNLGVATQTVGVALFSNESVPPNLVELVGEIAPRPVLLIYAVDGEGGEELNEEYLNAAQEPKELWAVDQGGHLGSQAAEPKDGCSRATTKGCLWRPKIGATGPGAPRPWPRASTRAR